MLRSSRGRDAAALTKAAEAVLPARRAPPAVVLRPRRAMAAHPAATAVIATRDRGSAALIGRHAPRRLRRSSAGACAGLATEAAPSAVAAAAGGAALADRRAPSLALTLRRSTTGLVGRHARAAEGRAASALATGARVGAVRSCDDTARPVDRGACALLVAPGRRLAVRVAACPARAALERARTPTRAHVAPNAVRRSERDTHAVARRAPSVFGARGRGGAVAVARRDAKESSVAHVFGRGAAEPERGALRVIAAAGVVGVARAQRRPVVQRPRDRVRDPDERDEDRARHEGASAPTRHHPYLGGSPSVEEHGER
jgi:hypothetical protein